MEHLKAWERFYEARIANATIYSEFHLRARLRCELARVQRRMRVVAAARSRREAL